MNDFNDWKNIRIETTYGKRIKLNKLFRSYVGFFDGGTAFSQYGSNLLRVLKIEDGKVYEKVDGSYNVPEKWELLGVIVYN